MHSLPLFLRLHGRPVILIGDGEAADARRRLLERAGARIVTEAEQAALAIVALEDETTAEAAVRRLRARGILVNAPDRPALCDFILPAIVDRDPVIVAIGTGGASAGLAKALRQRIEALLPTRLGRLAEGMRAARAALRARIPDAGDRRRAIDAALDPGGPLDPFTSHADDAVATWLAGPITEHAARHTRILLRSPDPDDLTLGEARLLAQADRIHHAADIPPAILNRARADAVRSTDAPPDAATGLTVTIAWLD